MTSSCTRLSRSGHFLIACALALLIPAGALAEPIVLWLPGTAAPPAIEASAVCFDGMAGRVLRVDAGSIDDFTGLGGRILDLQAGEALYVYLVEDAERAEFESPARVLLRSEHEVVLATPGEVPRLTEASRMGLSGLQQPVRVSLEPRAPRRAEGAGPIEWRMTDPLIAQMVGDLSSSSYMTTWHALEDFVTRSTTTPQNTAATQWILDEFLAMGLSAEFHEYNQSGVRHNVVATLPGLVDPSRIVYITAHMDATSGTPSTCAPGADDNGSGTAAVIEAARVLSQYAFQYTIKFVAFNGEEQGLIGSSAYCSDIAAAGEDVIGDFNADMIAYRGTDPAPPDLIIYTNSASQSLAATLESAVDTYLTGLIEPVVIVSSISASDHASFWNNGYQAVLAIEEEAWGPDFCPWYHTCNDLISQYPQDYVVNCSKALLAAVASTALPIDPTGSWLVVNDTTVDDDESGLSMGDGDGTVNPGETIELWVSLGNIGTQAATGVTGQLSSSSASVSVTTPGAGWSDIPSGGSGTNLTPFVFEVAGDAADGEMLPFTLVVTDDSGARELNMQLPVVAPRLAYYLHRLDDVSGGNANGLVDAGETVRIPVILSNSGGKDATPVSAVLASASPLVTVTPGQASAAQIPSGGTAQLSPGFEVAVAGYAPLGAVVELELAISAGTGYQAASSFKIKVGTHFYDDVEGDGAWSLVAGGDDATSGRWVRVDPVGSTYNGSQCQPENDHTAAPWTDCFVTGQGTVGGAAGDNDVDGGTTTLTSPTFDLTVVSEPRVTYWRWYTNNLGNNGGTDTWVVQVSNDGGESWSDLERTTQSQNSWQEMSFLIESVVPATSQMVFRFIASDLDGGSLVEAAVDDFEITGEANPIAVGGVTSPVMLRLDAARPSPARSGATIAFAVPASGRVTLGLFGVDGRLVRTLTDGVMPLGEHRLAWDGRTDGGELASPGVYFYRLQVGDDELTRRLVLVR